MHFQEAFFDCKWIIKIIKQQVLLVNSLKNCLQNPAGPGDLSFFRILKAFCLVIAYREILIVKLKLLED